MALQTAMVSSKSNEWSTPISLFNELNSEFHFTLDPCATQDNAKCKKYYTKHDNGLKQSWRGETVFMNPPYGGNTGKWIEKAWHESQHGVLVVCLIVSSTERGYWHDYIFPYAKEIRWLRSKLKFGDSKSSAPFGNVIVIFDGIKHSHQKQGYKKKKEGKWQYILI